MPLFGVTYIANSLSVYTGGYITEAIQIKHLAKGHNFTAKNRILTRLVV